MNDADATKYEVPPPSPPPTHDTQQRGHGHRHRGDGVKAVVLRLLANKPCLSFSLTLFFAMVLGALGGDEGMRDGRVSSRYIIILITQTAKP